MYVVLFMTICEQYNYQYVYSRVIGGFEIDLFNVWQFKGFVLL